MRRFIITHSLQWFSISGIWHYSTYYRRLRHELYPNAVYWLGCSVPLVLVLVLPLAIFFCRYKPVCCSRKKESSVEDIPSKAIKRRATGKNRVVPSTVVPALIETKAQDVETSNNNQERLAYLYVDSPRQQEPPSKLSSSKNSNISGSRVEISLEQTDIYTYTPDTKNNIIHIRVQRSNNDDDSVKTDQDSTYSSLQTTEQPAHF